MKNYRYPYPFIVVSGSVVDSTSPKTHFADLEAMAGTVSTGIYAADTLSIATGAGNSKKFFVGYSSPHTKDFLDKYLFGAMAPQGEPYWQFKGEDVISFEYSDPSKFSNERVVIGWSGSDGCNQKLPEFYCGYSYGIRVRAYGNEVTKRWGNDYIKEYWSKALPCTTPCVGVNCVPDRVNTKAVLTDLATQINGDYNGNFIPVKARVISSDYAAQTANMNIYQLVVQDDGSDMALGLVQQTIPASRVKRVNRIKTTSIYEVCSATAPAAFTPAPYTYTTEDCDGCEELPGVTITPATVAWTVKCTAYRMQRELCITLRKKECVEDDPGTVGVDESDRLAELKAFYTNYPNLVGTGGVPTITKTAGTACEDVYKVSQYSTGCMTDTCLAADTAKFEDLGGYDTGVWTVVEPAIPAYNAGQKAGLEISLAFDEEVVSDEEFSPNSPSALEPVRLEVTFLFPQDINVYGSNSLHKIENAPIGRKVSHAIPQSQTGVQVMRQFIDSQAYTAFGEDYQDATQRRVFNSNLRAQVNRFSKYRLYYLQFKVSRGNINFGQEPEVVEVVWAVDRSRPDLMTKLENAVLSPFGTKFGLTLKKRK